MISIFQVPMNVNAPEIVQAYFNYADEVGDYNKAHLPHFMTLTSSLKSVQVMSKSSCKK